MPATRRLCTEDSEPKPLALHSAASDSKTLLIFCAGLLFAAAVSLPLPAPLSACGTSWVRERARAHARPCIRLVSSRTIDTQSNRHTGAAAIISRSCRLAILEDMPCTLNQLCTIFHVLSLWIFRALKWSVWRSGNRLTRCVPQAERGAMPGARARLSGLGSHGFPAAALQSIPAR